MNQFNKETIIKAFRENLPFGADTITTAGTIKKILGINQKDFNQLKKSGLIKVLPDREYSLPDEWVKEIEEEIKITRNYK